MAIITLSNIRKSYGARDLFDDVSFFINERERAALIGANGTGKTTLLRIIYGEETSDSGSVNIEPGISIGYLPQDVDLPDSATLHLAVMGVTPELAECASEFLDLQRRIDKASEQEAHALGNRFAEVSHKFDTLNGFDYQVKAKTILIGLGFDESDLEKPVKTLSGGQKTRAALARLLLLSPDMLLLDEPTNHLDIQACEWLQNFMVNRYQGAALIVSHDRYFLDAVVDKVIELENCRTYTYQGNYSSFARQKEARIEEQRRLYKEQQKEIARIEKAIQTLFSDRKFSRRDSKVKQLNRIQRVNNPNEQRTISINLASTARSGRDVLRLSKLSKSFPGKELFRDVDFVVERGQKIGVVGPNGSGKTTLLKIIAGRLMQDGGEVIFGHNVKPLYFAQEFDHMVPERTVLEELLADSEINAKQARDLLAQFLFIGDDAFKKVEVLSGGEKCRLALAKVLADNPNLLLLDEPTNHLDIASRESLENALKSFNGTLMVASHDRYLLDAVTNGIVEIYNGKFTYYIGNYSDYKAKASWHQSIEADEKTNQQKKEADKTKPRPVSSLRELERLHRELLKKQQAVENEINRCEERLNEITIALGDEENYKNGKAKELTIEYNELSSRVESLYLEWEKICEDITQTQEKLENLMPG